MSISSVINTSLNSEFNVYPEDIDSEIGFQLSIIPKYFDNEKSEILNEEDTKQFIESKKKKIHFVVIIDKSGSMNGFPIISSLKVVEYLITNLLSKNDLISIISFDSKVTFNVPCIEVSDNIEYILTELQLIRANGCTNIPGAINGGIMELKKSDDSYDKQILLLTDGFNTVGPSNTSDIIESINNSNPDWKSFTFNVCGLGNNVDLNTLEIISSNSDGKMSIIESNKELIQIFGSMIATVLYQSINVFLTLSSSDSSIPSIELLNEEKSIFKNELRNKFKLDTMVIGESKDILLKVKTNQRDIIKYQIEVEIVDEITETRNKKVFKLDVIFNNEIPRIFNPDILISFLELETSKVIKEFSTSNNDSKVSALIQKIKALKIDNPKIKDMIQKLESISKSNYTTLLSISRQYAQRQVSADADYTSPMIRTVSSQVNDSIGF